MIETRCITNCCRCGGDAMDHQFLLGRRRCTGSTRDAGVEEKSTIIARCFAGDHGDMLGADELLGWWIMAMC
jgi:hypothetical protein